jgi:two-component system NarL family sensor kinase
MPFKMKVLLLAVLPLVLLFSVIAWVGFQIAADFIPEQNRIAGDSLRTAKEQALIAHVRMAISSIQPVLDNKGLDKQAAQTRVKNILRDLRYGKDGYFFVYDRAGIMQVHPFLTVQEGQKLEGKQNEVVQKLLATAQARPEGGIVYYNWDKPSTRIVEEEPKVGYAQMLPGDWGWMLGTGLYDVNVEVEQSLAKLNAGVQYKFQTILLVLGAAALLVSVLVFFTTLHESRLADRHLRELVHNFVQLQVDERRGFARKLHDDINQLMIAAKRQIETALLQAEKGNAQYKATLAESLKTLDMTIEGIRVTSHALRPALLDEMGLESALKFLLEKFQARTNITVQQAYVLGDKPVPDDAGITIYRVVEQALANIENHAKAQHATLALEQTCQSLQLTLHDDGQGFEPGEILGKGIGLKNMRERVELLSGDFVLESATGQGTRIQAILPLTLFERG